jgi:hypothetical protein
VHLVGHVPQRGRGPLRDGGCAIADRPCLLLVPEFTELQWSIKPQLEEWAEVVSYDAPGVGSEPPVPGPGFDLGEWRRRAAQRGLEEVDRRGRESFFVATDGSATPTGLQVAKARPEAVKGIAIGHAALSRSMDGERPAISREVWSGMGSLLRTDRESFIRHGLSQVTARSLSEETAGRIVERFPSNRIAVAIWDSLGEDPEPIEDDLVALGLPLLLGQHEGCLGSTDEGFEDIVARFPEAATVSCPEACAASPTFAEALREFCS